MAEEDGLFRSVDMSYVRLHVPGAVSQQFVDEIGREGCIQFTDLNEDFQPFQREYTSEIIKINDIQRQTKAIEELLDEYKVSFDGDVVPSDLQNNDRQPDPRLADTLGKEINDVYTKLKEQTTAEKRLLAEKNAQNDTLRVLSRIDKFLQSGRQVQSLLSSQRDQQQVQEGTETSGSPGNKAPKAVPLLDVTGNRESVAFKFFAGVVTVAQRVAFERQVFLTSRGNSFIQFDDENIAADEKIPFVVFFLGDNLKKSLKRLCQFMNIQICYESDSKRDRKELLREAETKKKDFKRVHFFTNKELRREMEKTSKLLKQWKITLIQEKQIRVTLNKFRSSSNSSMLVAEGWCPKSKLNSISELLDNITRNKSVGTPMLNEIRAPADQVAPTHFNTNYFTESFQTIVNTYGVPRYKEFNPAVPTIVTFPFLFGVMYGDMFHGSIIFLAVCGLFYLGRNMDLSKSEMIGSLYGGRYVLLFMSMFAIYCGMIYNDAMSIMINGWNGAQWKHIKTDDGTLVMKQTNNVYYVGVDPSWGGVDNQLTFENSLKMKLSVIIGVTQMTFGLFLKLANHIHEGDNISIFWEFIPQFLFMMSFFHYMIFLIIYKWCVNWKTSNLPETPSLITILINFILSPGSISDDSHLYNKDTQLYVQTAFLIIMFVSIPCMLFVKPFLLKSKWEREHGVHGGHVRLNDDDDDLQQQPLSINNSDDVKNDDDDEDDLENNQPVQPHGGGGHGHGHGDEFEFGEVFIHQLIHTIEYVLGTVSNTASYLRLWALSLAHAELSDVFYEKTIESSLSGGVFAVVETIAMVFMFWMFTFGVLLVMDVLECFLHALRLHWVEFQNKFYYADGVAFKPFSYENALQDEQ